MVGHTGCGSFGHGRMNRLALASASPRRAELLRGAGFRFEIHPAAIDESPKPAEVGIDLVQRLAKEKARTCLRECPELVVLAADTVVACQEQLYGKPADQAHYRAMMAAFSDATHEVISGVCVLSREREELFACTTSVTFGVLTAEWVDMHWARGEPCDKAGGYAIQGMAGSRIREIRGSYTNVVGLPMCETIETLAGFGIVAG